MASRILNRRELRKQAEEAEARESREAPEADDEIDDAGDAGVAEDKRSRPAMAEALFGLSKLDNKAAPCAGAQVPLAPPTERTPSWPAAS